MNSQNRSKSRRSTSRSPAKTAGAVPLQPVSAKVYSSKSGKAKVHTTVRLAPPK